MLSYMHNMKKCVFHYKKANVLGTASRFIHLSSKVGESNTQLEPWFTASRDGHTETLERLYQGEARVLNARDSRGWTALMHSTRGGHLENANYLINKGCDLDLKTRLGQTAVELALFWRQPDMVKLLTRGEKYEYKPSIFFTHSPLNRAAHIRSNDTWLFHTQRHPNTKFILMHHSKPVIVTNPDSKRSKLLTLDCFESNPFIDKHVQNLIFLGLNESLTDSSRDTTESNQDPSAYFAVGISDEQLAMVQEQNSSAHVLAMYPGVLQLSAPEAAIVGQARSLADWHHRYKFCPTCGSETALAESGYKRICKDQTCLSHTGMYNTNYPRTDPSVITAVVSRDSQQCLLGRKRSFPPGMYTCLAGFVEPGESVEMACRREVGEEAGVEVEEVEYVASQPWPMPNALMLGCLAYTQNAQRIKLDQQELEEAHWFSREEILRMLTATHPDRLFVPPPQAIAHQLIKLWAIRTA